MINAAVICRDRPTLTRQCLQTLLARQSVLITVTVVDDGSEEPTRTILRAANLGDNVFIVRNEKPWGIVGAVRNLSIEVSQRRFGRGDLLYLSDNDAYFNPGWLEKLLACWAIAANHGVKVLGAYNHPYNQPSAEKAAIPGPPLSGLEIKEVDALGGFSQLMAWETWDRYGPLRAEVPGVCQSEDWEFCQRIRNEGSKVACVYPHLVYNAGFTSTGGRRAVGHEAMIKIPGVIME